MEADKNQNIRQIFNELYASSEIKPNIKYKETEAVFPDKIDLKIQIEARINKQREFEIQEFQSNFTDQLSESIGVTEATQFIQQNFKTDIGLSVGDKFQSLEVVDLEDKKVTITHEKDQILMIDLWASWCGYCQEPFQHTIDMVSKNSELFKSKKIKIVGISRDQEIDKWKKHVSDKAWTIIPQFDKVDICDKYGIKSIPAIIIVNKSGKVAFVGHPNSIDIEKTLLNLSDNKNEVLSIQDKINNNKHWNSLSNSDKQQLVANINSKMKELGSGSRCTFMVKSTTVHDPDYNLITVNEPIFLGEVTQSEFESIKAFASTLETEFNLIDPKYQTKLLQISGDMDF